MFAFRQEVVVMWKSRALLRRYMGLASLFASPLLSGCHWQQTSFPANFAKPPSASATAPAVIVPVQQSPLYRAAVAQFARHDYPAALAGVTALLQQPQYQHRPADLDFLRRQQAICRHAFDPHAAAVPPAPLAAAPVTPRLASQMDCGPRALLLLCPQLGVRADGRKHGQQHECVPVRGDERLPGGGRRRPDAGGVPLLRRAGGAVHQPRHLPKPEALCLL